MSEETQECKPDDTEVIEEKQLAFDPKEVEEQLIKMAHERAEDPVETAASTYRMYLPYFNMNLHKLSTRGLRRVINFMVKYPLEQDDIKAASDFEKEFMHLTNTLAEAKFVMIMHTYLEHSQKLFETVEKPLTSEEESAIVEDLRAAGISEEDIKNLKGE